MTRTLTSWKPTLCLIMWITSWLDWYASKLFLYSHHLQDVWTGGSDGKGAPANFYMDESKLGARVCWAVFCRGISINLKWRLRVNCSISQAEVDLNIFSCRRLAVKVLGLRKVCLTSLSATTQCFLVRFTYVHIWVVRLLWWLWYLLWLTKP